MDWEEALRVVEAKASRVCCRVSRVLDWETASLSFLGMVVDGMVVGSGCEKTAPLPFLICVSGSV